MGETDNRRQVARLRRAIVTALALLLSPLPGAAQSAGAEPHACESQEADAVRIAVIFQRSNTGSRHREATWEACADFVKAHPKLRVRLQNIDYGDIEDGIEKLTRLLKQSEVDLVLGPTDSGVFKEALETVSMETGKEVPVVSSLVTAKVGNDDDGWFFRTNVDVAHRARVMYDQLSRSGYGKITVLYENSEFGRRAENAFARELSDAQRQSYASYRYEPDLDGIRAPLREVLDQRPGAVGIFGGRHHIDRIANELLGMNRGWNAYTPRIFSVIDARTTEREGLYFVSVVKPDLDVDDVNGLAYDTTLALLGIVEALPRPAARPDWPARFRSRLTAMLGGPPGRPGPRTHMRFDAFTNEARPQVYFIEDGAIAQPERAGEPLWITGLVERAKILHARFGWAPAWNLALVVAVVWMLSWIDLQRNHKVSIDYLMKPSFMALVLFNVFVAGAIFCGLGAFGALRWDRPINGLLVAGGYSGLLKTTVFQTTAGRAIGIAAVYNFIVSWLHDRIMRTKFRTDAAKINYIAIANSRSYLLRTLREMFECAPTSRAEALIKDLNEELAKAKGTGAQRRVLARKALHQMDWESMRARGIVPQDVPEEKIFDPELVVREATDYCIQKGEPSMDNLRKLVLLTLGQVKDEARRKEMIDEVEQDLGESTTEQARFGTYLRWLLVQHGFRIRALVKDGIVPPDFLETRGLAPKPKKRLEQRRARRRPLSMPAELRVRSSEGDGGEPASVALWDLSQGGARIVLSEEVSQAIAPKVDQELELSVQPEEAPGFDGLARVVHVAPGCEVDTIGVRWKELDDASRERLGDLVAAKRRAGTPAASGAARGEEPSGAGGGGAGGAVH